MTLRWPLAALLAICSITATAQKQNTSLLEIPVSVNIVEKPTNVLFNTIEQCTDLKFSYSPQTFDDVPVVTVIEENKTVRYILASTFGDNIRFRERGKYIIITDNRQNANAPFNQKLQIIEGYVTNDNTGEKISNATVYDQNLRVATVTDKYGYFKMAVPYGETASQIKVQKEGYIDTTIAMTTKRNRFLSFNLLPRDSLKSKKRIEIHFPKWIVSNLLQINTRNINDTLYRTWQASLIPGISTNRKLSGNVVNDYSFNVAGYSKGVRKFEIGLVANIVNGDARYVMIGGVNYVENKMTGVQMAHIYNRAGTLSGFQVAGVINQTEKKLNGIQMAGAINMLGAKEEDDNIPRLSPASDSLANSKKRSQTSTQVSGVLNKSWQAVDTQVSGVLNIITDKKKGKDSDSTATLANTNYKKKSTVQVAGAVNTSKMPTSVQVASLVNTSKSISQVQASGLYNQADTIGRVQLSPFNKAHVVKGVQLGLINFADSCQGVSIGLLSFIKNGYQQIEVSTDETFPIKTGLRTGLPYLYNIISFGATLKGKDNNLFAFEYGIGTAIPVNEKIDINADVTSFDLYTKSSDIEDADFYRLCTTVDYKINKHFSITAGLTANLMNYKSTDEFAPILKENLPNTRIKHDGKNDHVTCFWLGGKIGIRF